jgi:hypothetical protein
MLGPLTAILFIFCSTMILQVLLLLLLLLLLAVVVVVVLPLLGVGRFFGLLIKT